MKTKTVLSAVGGAMAAGACAMLVGAAVSTPSMKKMYKKKAGKAIKGTLETWIRRIWH